MGDLPGATKTMLEHYNNGLGLYRAMKWREALAEFRLALDACPSDGPSLLYVSRCEKFITDPPGEGWDGVFEAITK